MAVKLYPEVADRRRERIARDVAVMLMLLFLIWMGRSVYQRIDSITVLATGVSSAGESVQTGFGAVAGAVESVPVIGDNLASALQSSGEATGGNVADLGAQGAESIHRAALLIGLLTFLIPAILLLGLTLPDRMRGIRQMSLAGQFLEGERSPERDRILAMRAVFNLDVDHLLEYSADPVGDLIAGRHDQLIEALFAEAGLATPTR
ncbi:MAG: hypothetical protein F2942_08715 [Actinobacteria bacterium]|uniref:Unannotated protein n=1 Tax=freshwater metagenome TaxID=449393 RepID=A0A6J7US25_9ZZZZ|nr:hypothetical protein [Actinomycetota bacterium]MSX75597.1 hypothetical protein [Actinomycetota bacterium]MTA74784.1 hypothetical protein [Actinomycetota bacterium]